VGARAAAGDLKKDEDGVVVAAARTVATLSWGCRDERKGVGGTTSELAGGSR